MLLDVTRATKKAPAWSRFVLLACLAGPFLAGCGLFYEHSFRGSVFDLYTDHDPDLLSRTGELTEQIYQSYFELFDLPPEGLGRTSIFLEGDEGDDDVIDLKYAPELLGYYLPFFNLISVDTIPPWTREQDILRQILLHEICHHVLLTKHPRAGQECWLNEGLAGNLEMTLIGSEGFETPLLNPPLLKIARAAILTGDSEASLEKLLGLDWDDFHQNGKKEVHYALAWSSVYFLLERHFDSGRPLRERIEMLLEIDRDQVSGLGREWKSFLASFDLTNHLCRLSGNRDRTLTRRWAIQQLGTLQYLDYNRTLVTLLDGFDAEEELRREFYLSFLRAASDLEQKDYVTPDQAAWIREGHGRLRRLLLDPRTDAALRSDLLEAISDDLPKRTDWFPVFIDLLDSPESEVRVVAAQGLGRAEIKPTILNPDFWRESTPGQRRAEIDEWRTWWVANGPTPKASFSPARP